MAPRLEPNQKRRCGTCALWERDEDEEGHCTWDGAIPEWAALDNGDHRDYTNAFDGTRCRTWAEVEPKPA